MPRKLKVFRTAIGFHDAYVAAASRKAALAAWGAKADLFAREAAEEVTDPELMAEPLAKPGEVIQRPRGSFTVPTPAPPPRPAPKSRWRKPSRAALDKAEAALEAYDREAAADLARMQEREAALARERAAMERRHGEKRAELERRRAAEQEKWEDRLARWEGGGLTLEGCG